MGVSQDLGGTQLTNVGAAQNANDVPSAMQAMGHTIGTTQQMMMKPVIKSGITSGGSCVMYLTDDGTANGNALFPNAISFVEVDWNDTTAVYGKNATWSPDRKTLTIQVTKQTFTGISILSQAVLGAVSMQTAPDNTSLTVKVHGY